jgi:hypothetical protein
MGARVIGVVGVAGSGKILVADHLARRHGYRRLRFADCIKAALTTGMGLDPSMFARSSSAAPLPSIAPDHPLQLLRHHWGSRLVHPTVAAAAWARVLEDSESSEPIVADDVRYPQEAAAIKWAGGSIWRVVRPGLVVTDTFTEHSQASIEEDVLINNATTIEALLASVDMLAAQAEGTAHV